MQQSLVLHTRDYRESSVIVQLFGAQHGRVSAVLKGARRGKNAAAPQAFEVGVARLAGRGSLKTLASFERSQRFDLAGRYLYAGFYLLELVSRLLPEHQPEPEVMVDLLRALTRLEHQADLEHTLRAFEFALLNELGFGIRFDVEAGAETAVCAQRSYEFVPAQGFVASEHEDAIGGAVVAAVGRLDWQVSGVPRAAKRIARAALAELLGEKPLTSRQLFSAMQGRGNE